MRKCVENDSLEDGVLRLLNHPLDWKLKRGLETHQKHKPATGDSDRIRGERLPPML